MNHPIFRNYRSRMLYGGVWILVTSIQALIVYWAAGLPLGYAFVDSLVFNTIFATFIIPLWYPVRYNQWNDNAWYLNLAAHMLLSGILLALWTGSGYLLMNGLLEKHARYHHFLNVSVIWRVMEGSLFYIVTVLVYYLSMYIGKLNEKAANEIYLSQLVRDSELNLLKSQINPHFLFNSLNSLNALIIKDPQQAREMLVALSDYLRYTVMSMRDEVSDLQAEMENIQRYLAIEKLRFGDKLHYEFDIEPGCLLLKIPSMLLQPLFENAVKHGVYESIEAVHIIAKVSMKNECMILEISNDFDPENPVQTKGSGTGLKNIRERLQLSYGLEASLQTKITESKFIVVINMPIKSS